MASIAPDTKRRNYMRGNVTRAVGRTMGGMQAISATEKRSGSVVGQMLREWRTARRVSQLDLALQAGFSARHLSFIETGRTQPSRQALLILAETLDLPLRERNLLLEAGGYARMYRQTPLGADEMSHIRGLLHFILERHKPYAAIVLDRYANCVMGNGASERLVASLVDSSLLTSHANHLRIVFHPLGARRFIVNWEEVSHHLLGRAEREFGHTKDDEAAALLTELRGYAGPVVSHRASERVSSGDLLLPIHIRRDDFELRIFSTIMTLGTPQDVTLQDLRIETFFPADTESEAIWMRLIAPSDSDVAVASHG